MHGSRFLILADGEFGPLTSKTANSVIRYLEDRVVAVVDGVHAGKTAQDVIGFGGRIPVVGSMREGLSYKPDAVLIGIAPVGGKLPDQWRQWLARPSMPGAASGAGCTASSPTTPCWPSGPRPAG
jgi:Uncharacterized conserved protein